MKPEPPMHKRVVMLAACWIAFTASGCTPTPESTGPASATLPSQAPPAAPASTPATRTDIIPPRFRGEWNRVPADCGSGRNDSRLVLSADRVRFHESSGRVVSVALHGGNEVGIAVEMTGEGDRWTAHYRFRLSENGRELTDVGNGSGWVRQRCG
jgi:hypothetical protein